MSRFSKWLIALCCALSFSAWANSNDAVGYWQTIDEKTNKPSSLIQIWQGKGGIYYGKIAKIYSEDKQKQTDICKYCKGSRHNQRILGLTMITGMQRKSATQWGNGLVLDPRDGKEYHAQMWLEDGGKELHLRGYIGIPLFGKTAVWYRYS